MKSSHTGPNRRLFSKKAVSIFDSMETLSSLFILQTVSSLWGGLEMGKWTRNGKGGLKSKNVVFFLHGSFDKEEV
jgi:hypothetical protein